MTFWTASAPSANGRLPRSPLSGHQYDGLDFVLNHSNRRSSGDRSLGPRKEFLVPNPDRAGVLIRPESRKGYSRQTEQSVGP